MNKTSHGDKRRKLCIVSTSRLNIHFFFRQHITELSKYFDVAIALNPSDDAYSPPLSLPAREIKTSMQRKINILADVKTFIELLYLFRLERFDIVVTVAPKAGLLGIVAAAFMRVPHRVHIFQGEVWASQKGFMRWFLKIMDRIVAKLATHILVVSQSEQQFLEKEGVIRSGNAIVLGNGSIAGVDTSKFRPAPYSRAEFRKLHNIPEDAIVGIFLGRLTKDKGIFDLAEAIVKAAPQTPKLWFIIAGPDEDNIIGQFLPLCGEVRKRIIITGFTKEPEALMAAADFICLPSYREGFNVSVIEAAAVGVPSIVSRIYGTLDTVLDAQTGLFFTLGNIDELATLIMKLVADDKLRSYLGQNARERVKKHFDQTDVVGRYVNFFRELGNGAGHT